MEENLSEDKMVIDFVTEGGESVVLSCDILRPTAGIKHQWTVLVLTCQSLVNQLVH